MNNLSRVMIFILADIQVEGKLVVVTLDNASTITVVLEDRE